MVKYIKLFINCLTILFLFLPFQSEGMAVKEIIKNHLTDENCVFHGQNIDIHINEFALPQNHLDGKQIVVIDAGHGGHDPGTSGKLSKEKDIALSIALKLGKKIAATDKNIEIVYTRKTDIFIPLHKRIDIANKKKADIFVSIHCNYVGNPHICGTETYVMGLHRADDNLTVAKRENSVVLLEQSYEKNYGGYDPNSPVGHILLSAFQNLFIENSISLASSIETHLEARKSTKSRGVKQAGFVVLREATMPAVLVEAGFLSNPKEEKYLMSEKGQNQIALSVSKGIEGYLTSIAINEEVISKSQEKEEIIASEEIPNKTPRVQDQKNNQETTSTKYVIQTGVYSKKKSEKYINALKNYGTVNEFITNGKYIYSVGTYHKKMDAHTVCEMMRLEGFPDAFIKKILLP